MSEQTTLILAGSLGAVGMVGEDLPTLKTDPDARRQSTENGAPQNWRNSSEQPGERLRNAKERD